MSVHGADIRIVGVDRRHWQVWREMRDALYPGNSEDENAEKEMEILLASKEWAIFIAEDAAGRPLGLLELSFRNIVDGCLSSPVGYVEGIYVSPVARRLGLGRRLIGFAADFFAERGCREMALDSRLEDEAAQAFHRHMGFEETERIVQFKMDLPTKN